MAFQHTSLTPELGAYMSRVSLREPDVLRQLRQETAHLEMAVMQVTPEQGQFMRLLVEMIGARRAIEVGVFTGYSSICIASALAQGGRLIACDVNTEWTAIARRFWVAAGVSDKIDLHIQPAVKTLDGLIDDGLEGTFDFMFIDGDKRNYDNYYERGLRLLRTGGLMAIDNVLWHGSVIDPSVSDPDTQAIRALNDKVHADPRVAISLVPIGDGVMLARKQ
jgi:predicted O-methyltransferase YrrM